MKVKKLVEIIEREFSDYTAREDIDVWKCEEHKESFTEGFCKGIELISTEVVEPLINELKSLRLLHKDF